MTQYHHCRSLDGVVQGIVKASPGHADVQFKKAYEWLEKKIGFYPLFVAVGNTEEAIRMTGYKDQFRKNGNKRNDVLFSFEKLDGIYMDFDWWHIPLNDALAKTEIAPSEKEMSLMFKKSYSPGDWLRKANRNPGSVQLVVNELNLAAANAVNVRNATTKKILKKMGFNDVRIKKMYIRGADRFI